MRENYPVPEGCPQKWGHASLLVTYLVVLNFAPRA
ncbi:MAG: hypothetical protein JWR07_4329 [Nevskia sp.]|nr:hypothetical protein [Nevskia sp.]